MKRKRLKDFPLVRRTLLQIVHKLQVKTIRMGNINLYYLLSKIHFKLWFRVSLENCMIDERPEAKLAMKRHSRLVLKYVLPEMPSKPSDAMRKSAMQTFQNNILLNAEL
jgi:hypothetical protein